MDSVKYKKNDVYKKICFRKKEEEEQKDKRDAFLGNKRGSQNDMFEYTGKVIY
jgi:hypothetical protein